MMDTRSTAGFMIFLISLLLPPFQKTLAPFPLIGFCTPRCGKGVICIAAAKGSCQPWSYLVTAHTLYPGWDGANVKLLRFLSTHGGSGFSLIVLCVVSFACVMCV
ncbi:hypothetical protein K505DRAFT_143879 [Melanomma pulvis-pyrius CBS 109.77]|uniref:Secreted protein n=1 Tax=Melanomma pulvis-pyrius CBS 109.77 TaxID=1314802 RepID=A0A6A6XLX9_9PLEO|nr:hypothetical protein K505DRAFT_143879 [Melanomma pulvis-pyrius CBS 109.77]